MAVKDHGIEVLKKSGEEVTPGDKSDYYIKTKGLGSLIQGLDYDTIAATYPTTSSEVYTYTLSAATVRTVTVTYTDASKDVLTSVVYS